MTILVAIIALLVVAVVWIFNRLVTNLVEVVEGYVLHERRTLERVTQARARAENVRREGDPASTASSENGLSGELRTLFAVAEAYPDLKASDRFLDLQRSLVEIEDALQNARRYYNAVVRDLNTRVQSFPDLLLARPLGFEEWEFFQLESAAEAVAPSIEIDTAGDHEETA